MFDVTPGEIALLNDTDLRTLVGRLCEAELSSRGHSPAAVTYGGSQTAPDGGVDVRVALTGDAAIDGFIPRPSTVFQVKKSDMPKSKIDREMRFQGRIRPVIRDVADEAGAYIIVSSRDSTADSALEMRRAAMRKALTGVANADRLTIDFYDRTRLASWVRLHPGLITWVKEKVGRAFAGWRPFGPWSGVYGSEVEYLLDDKLRLRLAKHHGASPQQLVDAIDELRDELAQPRKIVRLVGLAGVGKTRLVEALFDARVGARPLPPSLAVYTNLSDDPDPQPMGLASDLIANRRRAILVIDNCSPDLHRRLSDLCLAAESTLSVITVEYDLRDDQFEGTHVVTLDTSSPELIKLLVTRRYPHLSSIDARTIAEASGGNARIAIQLAGTVEHTETIAGLSDGDLFRRLFRQGREPDEALFLAAQVCSLVYSFQGVAFTGEDAELPILASLADQSPRELHRHVAELLRRDLVQRRGVWRAVLPHAIANYLAALALENIPYEFIDQHLVTGGTKRLARSFSRRLSFLHDRPRAAAIVERWLAPGGLLGDINVLDDDGEAMFQNVAPVLPEAALAALERAIAQQPDGEFNVWGRYSRLLCSLTYDPILFDRSAFVLAQLATQNDDERRSNDASGEFTSLFTLYLSGTHASIEQRLSMVERLLRNGDRKQRSLGLSALDRMLETVHFSSRHQYEFGARSRDYGYWPANSGDVARWYGKALASIERLADTENGLDFGMLAVLARNFHGLWASTLLYDDLDRLFRRFSKGRFWQQGWLACRETIHLDKDQSPPEISLRLAALEDDLSPSDLPSRVQAFVIGDWSYSLDLENEDESDIANRSKWLDDIARDLGMVVAVDGATFAQLVPTLLRGGQRVETFGRGLATSSKDHRIMWTSFVEGLGHLPLDQRNGQVLRGYLAELWELERGLAEHFLDAALDQPDMTAFIPELQSAVQIDERGVERLKRAFHSGLVPVRMYRLLPYWRSLDQISGGDLKDLIFLIAQQAEGFDVALEIAYLRLCSDRSAQIMHAPDLLEAGRYLLRTVVFRKSNDRSDRHLASIVRASLSEPESALLAGEVAARLRSAVASYETSPYGNKAVVRALLRTQPSAVLDALFEGGQREQQTGATLFGRLHDNEINLADEIPTSKLVGWCERHPEPRYPLAASFVSFAQRPEGSDHQVWSEHASALIAQALDPQSVLTVFIRRFRPSWLTDGRAALLEMNARLLDCLDPEISARLAPFLADARSELAHEIARERRLETERDRGRDERFE